MKLGKIVAVLLACIFALGLLACKKTDDPVIDIGGSASPNQTDASATQQGSVADSATPNSEGRKRFCLKMIIETIVLVSMRYCYRRTVVLY